ncbi:MAG: uncharacterized protein KVP18_003222, partial [Porospora cf. gigantea A]
MMFTRISLLALSAMAASTPQLDVFLVQDLSYSFENDLRVLEEKIPTMLTKLSLDYPGSRFGMASFVDKPVEPFGFSDSGDYCYKLHQPLAEMTDTSGLGTILSSLETYSGNDWEENQLDALMHTVRSVASGWNFEEDRVPILVISTDAGFHRAGDGHAKAGSVPWHPNAGGYDVNCSVEDYPSMSQVAEAINEKEVKVVFLVSPDLMKYYNKAKDDMGIDGVVVDLQTDSSNIVEAMESAIEQLRTKSLLQHTPLKNAHGFGDLAARALKDRIEEESRLQVAEKEMNAGGFSSAEKVELENRKARFARNVMGVRPLRSSRPPTPLEAARAPLGLPLAAHPPLASPRGSDVLAPAPLGLPLAAHPPLASPRGSDGLVSGIAASPTTRQAEPTTMPPPAAFDGAGRRLLNCPVHGKKDIKFEIVLAQDASDSFADDLVNIQKNVPEVFEFIREQYGDSRFGVASFVDKPLAPFGYSEAGDYCATMRVGLTSNMRKIQKSLDSLVVRSGRDWKESQLHALMHSAYTKKADWSFDSKYYDTYRVVVLSTDAGYHVAGDSDLPKNNGDRSQNCEGEDYPSIEQVRDALMYFNIYPVFMVTSSVRTIYDDLLNKLNLPGVVVEIDEKSAKFEEALIESLNNVCHAYFPNKPVDINDHACCHQHGGHCDQGGG